jgi:hypothetical protein
MGRPRADGEPTKPKPTKASTPTKASRPRTPAKPRTKKPKPEPKPTNESAIDALVDSLAQSVIVDTAFLATAQRARTLAKCLDAAASDRSRLECGTCGGSVFTEPGDLVRTVPALSKELAATVATLTAGVDREDDDDDTFGSVLSPSVRDQPKP